MVRLFSNTIVLLTQSGGNVQSLENLSTKCSCTKFRESFVKNRSVLSEVSLSTGKSSITLEFLYTIGAWKITFRKLHNRRKHRRYRCRFEISESRCGFGGFARERKWYQGHSEKEAFSISVFTIGFASKSFDCAIYPDQVDLDVRFFLVTAWR